MLEKFIEMLLYDVDASGAKQPRQRTFGLRTKPTPSVEKKLMKMLSESSMVNTGRVQLLGLKELKEKMGDRWLDLRESILTGLEQIVLKRIGNQDVFFSRSEEEHLIVFAHLAEDEARLVCAKILQELSIKFLGQVETREIVVRTAVGQFDGQLTFEEDTLDNILSNIGMKENASLSGDEEDPSDARSASNLLRFFSGENDRIRELFKVTYVPIWDSRHQVLSTYAVDCQMRDKVSSGNYSTLIKRLENRDRVSLDYMLADECGNQLLEFYAKKYRAVFCLPVCYDTVFNSQLLTAYSRKIVQIPKELSRYTMITLKGFPQGMPSGKILDIVAILGRYCPVIMLDCDEFIPKNLDFYKECGLKGIRVRLDPDKSDSQEYWSALATTIDKCRKKTLKVSLIEVGDRKSLQQAYEYGFDYISGDAVRQKTSAPGHMLRVNFEELIAGDE
ncbi:hypothetical protein [Emcibacter nanhaiensis]|uniref:EAL domain-containing protein n=1 Tax=Emcibacter nanhaiensis TaxID=1505037 RepID=A0A501PQM4_9PROT|nr:hypothetical protein [Emcibacter nanhaiensis]TPD62763.1 hypothetical protein FIV46_01405 [Emcibacter nanhaiensis]